MNYERGTEVDRYVVDSVLGQGGMAAVYKVMHRKLDTPYALKVLTVNSASIEQRLLREGKVQASLRHPNVVAVIDVIELNGASGLIMEYVEGPSLEEYLGSHRLELSHLLALAYGIIAGVNAAHQAGFVHRDLKPANIMLQAHGERLIPKVADFGLAKVLAGDDGMRATRSGTTMGTPSYMAPEQIRNAKEVDHRADIFALGCILYEMATGAQAFPGDDLLEIFTKVSVADYIPLSELAPDLPPQLKEVIEGALQVDRDDRIASCQLLLDALRTCNDGADPRISTSYSADFMASARQLTDEVTLPETDSPLGATFDLPAATPAPASSSGSGGAQTVVRKQELSVDTLLLPSGPPSQPPTAASTKAPSSLGRKLVLLLGGGGVALVIVLVVVLGAAGLGITALMGGGMFYNSSEPSVAITPGTSPVTATQAPNQPTAEGSRKPAANSSATAQPPTPGAPLAPGAPSDDTPSDDTPNDGVAAAASSAPAASCDDTAAFEDAAAKGEVAPSALRCLVGRLHTASAPQTERDKAGRIVLRNAKARCDKGSSCKAYEREQHYFFEEVSRSDAEMMFIWTEYLYGSIAGSAERREQANTWATKALGRKDQWAGAKHINRVDKLYEIKARLAYARFEADHKSPKSRTKAKNAAIRWINYRIELGRDYTEGLNLCASAAGSKEVCEKQLYEEKAVITITLASMPPGAKLFVDGKEVGETPKAVELPYGKHAIKLVAGSKESTKAIDVGAKEPATWMWRASDNSWKGRL